MKSRKENKNKLSPPLSSLTVYTIGDAWSFSSIAPITPS